jgi:hypothetical protein
MPGPMAKILALPAPRRWRSPSRTALELVKTASSQRPAEIPPFISRSWSGLTRVSNRITGTESGWASLEASSSTSS